MIIYKLPSNFKCDHKLPTKVIINCQLMWSLTATMLHNVWCILLYYKSTVLVLQYSTQKFSCTVVPVIYVTHSESVLMTHLKGPPPSDMLEHIVKICDFYLFRCFLILRGLPHTCPSRNRLVEYCDQNERNRGSWSQIRLEILPGVGAGKAIPILGRLGTATGSRLFHVSCTNQLTSEQVKVPRHFPKWSWCGHIYIYIYIAAPLHMLWTLLEICAFRLSKGMESSIFCSTSRRLRRSLVSASYFTAYYCKCKWTNPSLLDLGATEPRFKDHHRHLWQTLLAHNWGNHNHHHHGSCFHKSGPFFSFTELNLGQMQHHHHHLHPPFTTIFLVQKYRCDLIEIL